MTTSQLRDIGVENFSQEEFIPSPELLPVRYRSAWHIRPNIARAAQLVRDIVGGPVWINTWHGGPGHFQLRGVRPPDDKVGAWWSQHKLANAFDFHVPNWTPQDVWDLMHENAQPFHELGITTLESLEDTTDDGGQTWGWIHADGRFVRDDELLDEGQPCFKIVRH